VLSVHAYCVIFTAGLLPGYWEVLASACTDGSKPPFSAGAIAVMYVYVRHEF
jgi:hypothetical protein